MKSIFKYLFIFLFILFFSCVKDTLQYGNYPTDIGLLIKNNCSTSGCHNSNSFRAADGLNLENWEAMFAGSNSGSPVIPFSSKFSSLCYFINTFSALGIQNKPTMPLNQPPLSKDDVKLIKNWIDAGAPDINGKIMWAENPQRRKLYAVNQGCDVITVFDSESQIPIRFIQVGTKLNSTPHHLRVSPDGNYWYVIFINCNVMQKFRCSDDVFIGNIPLNPYIAGVSNDPINNSQDWNSFIISNDGKKAYCTSFSSNGKVAAVDLENLKLIHFLPGIAFAHGIVLNEKEDTLYVTSQYGNYITKIDTGFSDKKELSLQNNLQWTSNSILDPHDIILAPNKKDILITCQKSNEVRVFNTITNSVTSIILTGILPQEIIYSKKMNQYYVSCSDDTVSFINSHGSITRINASNYNDIKTIACGFQPHGIAVDETKNMLYVLSRNILSSGPIPHHTSQCNGKNGFVNFIDLNLFTLLPKQYELSVDPYFIFARP